MRDHSRAEETARPARPEAVGDRRAQPTQKGVRPYEHMLEQPIARPGPRQAATAISAASGLALWSPIVDGARDTQSGSWRVELTMAPPPRACP